MGSTDSRILDAAGVAQTLGQNPRDLEDLDSAAPSSSFGQTQISSGSTAPDDAVAPDPRLRPERKDAVSPNEELLVEVVHRITTDFSARLRRETGSGYRRSLKEYLVSMWEHLCEPRERRQFLLLFELVTVASREPGEKVALARSLVDEIIESVQKVLERHRYSKKHARIVATSILAQVRGLHLDLAISGALSRVDAAMRDYIDMIVRADLGSAR